MNKRLTFAAVAAAALTAPAAAFPHVTVHPNSVPSGGFTVLTVRVPNEIDNARTRRVDVKMPNGFISVSYQPVPGWSVQIKTTKLAKPVLNDDGVRITSQVSQVIFTSKTGLGKDQYMDFPLSVAVPSAKAGSTLTFKALQTYSNGKVVRWIGSPSTDNPAPQVLVTSKSSPVRDYPAGVSAARSTQSATVLGGVAAGAVGIAGIGLAVRRRRSA
jgi:periplasmic copper chaperone A